MKHVTYSGSPFETADDDNGVIYFDTVKTAVCSCNRSTGWDKCVKHTIRAFFCKLNFAHCIVLLA